MKVGTHAQETLEAIIERKTREIEEAGYAMWGYGGNTCHPRTMVQPFAKTFEMKGSQIHLVMEEMASKHFAEPVRADEYSVDGDTWESIPTKINVLGSRFALTVQNLRREEFQLGLDHTRVAVGNQMGRRGGGYLQGRVDKACLEVVDPPEPLDPGEPIVEIGLVADLVPPYAVFLRNRL